MKKIFALALVLCMIFALTASAYADFAPTGPVSMIVSYKAGSGTDNTARILAKYAEKYVGQTIVIDGPSSLTPTRTARPSASSTSPTSPAPSSTRWAPTPLTASPPSATT